LSAEGLGQTQKKAPAGTTAAAGTPGVPAMRSQSDFAAGVPATTWSWANSGWVVVQALLPKVVPINCAAAPRLFAVTNGASALRKEDAVDMKFSFVERAEFAECTETPCAG
jgi:hypothetical protein